MNKYGSYEDLEITRKHLKMTKQGEKEGFSDFVTRWREMTSQMSKRPDEEEQLEIIQKNFTPDVLACMGKHVFPHFRALLSMGSQVEEELAKKSNTEPKKTPGQYAGKKTTAPAVNQLSSYPQNPYQQQNPFPQQKPVHGSETQDTRPNRRWDISHPCGSQCANQPSPKSSTS